MGRCRSHRALVWVNVCLTLILNAYDPLMQQTGSSQSVWVRLWPLTSATNHHHLWKAVSLNLTFTFACINQCIIFLCVYYWGRITQHRGCRITNYSTANYTQGLKGPLAHPWHNMVEMWPLCVTSQNTNINAKLKGEQKPLYSPIYAFFPLFLWCTLPIWAAAMAQFPLRKNRI